MSGRSVNDPVTGDEMGDYGTGKGAPIPSVSNADLQRENAVLRDIVRALTEAKDAGTFYSTQHQAQTCVYCRAENTEAVGYVDVPHAPDCPIVQGRAALAKGD